MPQQGENCPRTTDMFWRNALSLKEGTLACCFVFSGLLLLFFNRELVALSLYGAGANLPREMQRPWSDCTPQKHRLPSISSNKMVGNTQGIQTPFLSSAAAYSRWTISMKHVESNFYPSPVKTYFGPCFQDRVILISRVWATHLSH